eukprot:2745728-Pleurochrysis_carterae.AAC.1
MHERARVMHQHAWPGERAACVHTQLSSRFQHCHPRSLRSRKVRTPLPRVFSLRTQGGESARRRLVACGGAISHL